MAPVTVDEVKDLLFKKHCVKIPSREWLEQCVEFIVDAEEVRTVVLFTPLIHYASDLGFL